MILRLQGSIGHALTVCLETENANQHEMSVLSEHTEGNLRNYLTDVPRQPNPSPDCGFQANQKRAVMREQVERNMSNYFKSIRISRAPETVAMICVCLERSDSPCRRQC